MKFGDLVRMPAGTVHIYETTRGDRKRLTEYLSSACYKIGGKIQFTAINGFTSDGLPVYLLRVEVIKAGAPRKPRGRAPGSKE